MKVRQHKLLDHPILGYFLLALFAMLVISLGSYLDSILIGLFPALSNGNLESGIGSAVGAIAALAIFTLWFRPDFSGCLSTKGFLTGLLMLLPLLVVHYTGSIVSWHQVGTGNIFLAFVAALAPGFGEEVVFRGLGVANYMRTIRSERQIPVIFWLSSIVFGLIHLSNILAGGDTVAVLIQAPYAIGVGMALGAVYLRTGNLWPCMIGHFSLDFTEMIRADLAESGGVMTGIAAGDWLTMVAAAIGAIWGLYLIRPKYRQQIMDTWKKKWS